MIRSMTGFGTAEVQSGQWTISVEVRSVNHRDLQISFRVPEVFHLKEFELQKLIERRMSRGHLYLSLNCRQVSGTESVLVDRERLLAYVKALGSVAAESDVATHVDLASLLRMPGVMQDASTDEGLREQLWPAVVEATKGAMDALVVMREAEGTNLARQLTEICDAVEELVAGLEGYHPELVVAYQDRLRERVEKLLAGQSVPLNEDALAREVALYADRSDVSEEIARVRSHLEQFREALAADSSEPVGRRMEFLGQELLREASTTAAKIPGNTTVRSVLDMKSQIDRLREQVRNVE